MEKTAPSTHRDITQEPYKGPSSVVVGVGEGAIAHYGLAALGFIVGGLISFVAHKPVTALKNGFTNFHTNHAQSGNFFMKAVGGIAGFISRAAEWIVGHIPEKVAKFLFSKVPEKRMEAVVFGSGMSAAAGFFLSPIYFMFSGARHANQGKEQFDIAKSELITERAGHAATKEELAATKQALEDAKAQPKPVHASAETNPAHEALASKGAAHADKHEAHAKKGKDWSAAEAARATEHAHEAQPTLH